MSHLISSEFSPVFPFGFPESHLKKKKKPVYFLRIARNIDICNVQLLQTPGSWQKKGDHSYIASLSCALAEVRVSLVCRVSLFRGHSDAR